MIIGIGLDIIEVARIEAATQKETFMHKIFTDAEREYFKSQGFGAQSMAGTFAAKEAVAKALAVGFRGLTWTDIEILHDELGKPYAVLKGGALERMKKLSGKNLHISISHIKELAVAQAILEE